MATRKEYFYFVDTHTTGEKLAIVEKATNTVTRNGWSSNYRTVQTAGTNNIKIRGVFTDTDLSNDALTTTYDNIPARFHSAIVSSVISMGYLNPLNFDTEKGQLFGQMYHAEVKRAKTFSKRNYISTGRVVPQDF